MEFMNIVLSFAEILCISFLLTAIIVGYTITFSWTASIKLLINSFLFAFFKKTRMHIYQQMMKKSVHQDLHLILKSSNHDIEETFKNTDLKELTGDEIKTLAKQTLNEDELITEMVKQVNLNDTPRNWVKAYQYLADEIAHEIINSYQKKRSNLTFNQSQIDNSSFILSLGAKTANH